MFDTLRGGDDIRMLWTLFLRIRGYCTDRLFSLKLIKNDLNWTSKHAWLTKCYPEIGKKKKSIQKTPLKTKTPEGQLFIHYLGTRLKKFTLLYIEFIEVISNTICFFHDPGTLFFLLSVNQSPDLVIVISCISKVK